MIRKRRSQVTPEDRILIAQGAGSSWGKDNALDKFKMIKALTGDSEVHKPGRGDDARCMRAFLASIDPSTLQNPGITPWLEFIPERSPILDYLVVHIEENNDSWKIPSVECLKELQLTRTLSYKYIDHCEVREIIAGESSSSEIQEFADWVKTMQGKDNLSLPCSGLSLCILTQDLSLRDVHRMSGRIRMEEGKKIAAKDLDRINYPELPSDKWVKVPVKIIIGNGTSWAAVVSVDLGTAGRPWIQPIQIQKSIIEFLQNLPVCVGVGIKQDVRLIEQFYGTIVGYPLKIKFMELGVLAHIAGWQMRGFSLSSLSVQVTGTILNRCVDAGDEKWGQKWEYIARSMKVFALGNLKAGHAAMVVLMGVIIRDIFPDPDVLCKQLRLFQVECCRWICELLLGSCENKEINLSLSRGATTREELIRAIRVRVSPTELSDRVPHDILFWVKLLGSWPAITKGGPRYLLHCRVHFIQQMDVIKDQGISWDEDNSMKIPDEDDVFYCLFGMNRDRLIRVNWGAPLKSSWMGLELYEPVQSHVLKFDPNTTKDVKKIVELCKERRLTQRGCILEWARVYPELIPSFLKQMSVNLAFRGWFKPYYDVLRLMYRRVIHGEAPRIEELDRELDTNFWRQKEVEESKLKSVTVELRERQSRVDWFEDAIKQGSMIDRARLLHRLPQLSSKKSCKRGRSRSRSCARRNVAPRQSTPSPRRRFTPSPSPVRIRSPSVELVIEECNEVAASSNVEDSVDIGAGEDSVRKVVLVDDPFDILRDSDESDVELRKDGEGDVPSTGNIPDACSEELICLKVDVMAQPVPSVSQDSSSGIWSSDVSTNKKGVPKMCSYTEYLKRKRAKESSDEDLFEIETPEKLLESLKF